MTHREREILQAAHDAGVILTVDGDRLRFQAPAGALTPALRAALADVKPDIVYEYHERAGILEYDARLPRAEAEARATEMLNLATGKAAAAGALVPPGMTPQIGSHDSSLPRTRGHVKTG